VPAKVWAEKGPEAFPFEAAYVRPCRQLFGCVGGSLAERDDAPLQPGTPALLTMGWLLFHSQEQAVRAAQWVRATPIHVFREAFQPSPEMVRVSHAGGRRGPSHSEAAHAFLCCTYRKLNWPLLLRARGVLLPPCPGCSGTLPVPLEPSWSSLPGQRPQLLCLPQVMMRRQSNPARLTRARAELEEHDRRWAGAWLLHGWLPFVYEAGPMLGMPMVFFPWAFVRACTGALRAQLA
jgi:hypothetical protein